MNIERPLYRRHRNRFNFKFILQIIMACFVFCLFFLYPVQYRSHDVSSRLVHTRQNIPQPRVLFSSINHIQPRHHRYRCLSEPKHKFNSIVVHGNLGILKTKDNKLINCYIANMMIKETNENTTILLKEYKNQSEILALRHKEVESILQKKSIYPFIDCWKSPKITYVDNQTMLYDISCLWSAESIDVIKNVLMNYYYYPQDTNNPILFFNPNYFLTQRERFVKKTILELMRSISYMHECNIVHNNIDKNCIILKTLKDTEYKKQKIQLTRFDDSVDISNVSRVFIRNIELPDPKTASQGEQNRTFLDNILNPEKQQNSPIKSITHKDVQEKLLQKEYRNIGLVITEFIFSSFSLDGPSPRVSKSLLEKRFIFNDFNIRQFRDFCMRDENNKLVIDILDKDNYAGWDFLDTLFHTRQNMSIMLDHRFLIEGHPRL